jgi:hypothetical protein
VGLPLMSHEELTIEVTLPACSGVRHLSAHKAQNDVLGGP